MSPVMDLQKEACGPLDSEFEGVALPKLKSIVVGSLLVASGCSAPALDDAVKSSTAIDDTPPKQNSLAPQDSVQTNLPSDPRVIELLASGHLENENYSKAAELYQRVLDIEPTNQGVHESLAYSLFRAERYQEARTVYQSWVSLDPNSSDALMGVVRTSDKLDDEQAAQSALRVVLTLEPDNLGARQMLANSLFKSGELSEARDIYVELLTDAGNQQPDEWNAAINLRLARLSRELGQSLESIKYYEQALKLNSNDQKALFELASTRLEVADSKTTEISRSQKLELTRSALDDFEALTKLRPDYAPYFMRTAQIAQSLGDVNKADRFARQGMKLDSSQKGWGEVILGRSASIRGDAAFKGGDYSLAQDHYTQAALHFEQALGSGDQRFRSYASKEIERQSKLVERAKTAAGRH